MEVNIVEQLFPNGLTVLTQLCSTLVLFLIAKHFSMGISTELFRC